MVNATIPREEVTGDDVAWILSCGFLILTMQTGFAMLECGCVSSKNVANIMVKNVIDVCVGGFSYWIFGYSFSFGSPSNAFMGYGSGYFFSSPNLGSVGTDYARYFFQFSFATTATTIVSGAVAERMKLNAYMMFSFLNSIVYCIPASWVWNTGVPGRDPGGWLLQLGFFDFAGTCVVHLTGGVSALVAASMLGPRLNRFENPQSFEMSSPVTSLSGMFMLWWAWLGFNCGSTFGVGGHLWKAAALVSVTTLNGGIGGGLMGLSISMYMKKGKISVDYTINSVLGGLVGITGIAPVTTPTEALIIGMIGGLVAVVGLELNYWLRIDDPVGAIPVHCYAAFWGTIAVGIFGHDNEAGMLSGRNGFAHKGGLYLLGVQIAGASAIVLWSATTTYLELYFVRMILGLRMSQEEEMLGADWCEHDIHSEIVSDRLKETLSTIAKDEWGDLFIKLNEEVNAVEAREVKSHTTFGLDANTKESSLKRQETHNNIDANITAAIQSKDTYKKLIEKIAENRQKSQEQKVAAANSIFKTSAGPARGTNENLETPIEMMTHDERLISNSTVVTEAEIPAKRLFSAKFSSPKVINSETVQKSIDGSTDSVQWERQEDNNDVFGIRSPTAPPPVVELHTETVSQANSVNSTTANNSSDKTEYNDQEGNPLDDSKNLKKTIKSSDNKPDLTTESQSAKTRNIQTIPNIPTYRPPSYAAETYQDPEFDAAVEDITEVLPFKVEMEGSSNGIDIDSSSESQVRENRTAMPSAITRVTFDNETKDG